VAAIDRRSVADRQLLAPIDQAGVIYFSGGDPGYLLSALRGSPLWRAVHQRYLAGAVLVGASAGAMVLGRYTPANIYAVAETGVKPDWQPALDLAPYNVIPHYDYIAREDPAVLAAVLKAAPAEVTNGLIGIDEDTALIIGKPTETVMGRGGVHRL
jgi:cyanophycinase